MQRQTALETLQKNLKEEYRAVVDYEVAFFNTVHPLPHHNSLPDNDLFELLHLTGIRTGAESRNVCSSLCRS